MPYLTVYSHFTYIFSLSPSDPLRGLNITAFFLTEKGKLWLGFGGHSEFESTGWMM